MALRPPTSPPGRTATPVPIDEDDSDPFQWRPVEMSESMGDIWLIRVPDFVRDAWMAAIRQNTSEPLGDVTLRRFDGSQAPEITIKLPSGAEAPVTARQYKTIPQRYSLRLNTRYERGNFARKENTFLYREDDSGAPHSFAGKVSFEGSVTPLLSANDQVLYDRLLRSRTLQSTVPLHQTKEISDRDAARAHSTGAQREVKKTVFGSNKLSDKNRARNEAARVRADRNVFLQALYALFAEREAWTLAELARRTGQNHTYTREVVSEIGQPAQAGDPRGTWKLRPEYRQAIEASRAADRARDAGGQASGANGAGVKADTAGVKTEGAAPFAAGAAHTNGDGAIEVLSDDEQDFMGSGSGPVYSQPQSSQEQVHAGGASLETQFSSQTSDLPPWPEGISMPYSDDEGMDYEREGDGQADNDDEFPYL